MKHMKVLHLVRHAKSAWDNNDVADIDRPLKSKGIRNAYDIARKLKLSNLVPQRIISSPADRAMHTAVIFARVFGLSLTELVLNNALYASSKENILKLVKATGDDCKSLMIVGHNPEFTELANHFLTSQLDNVPTSGAVTLKFDVQSWKDIHPANLDEQVLNFPNKED